MKKDIKLSIYGALIGDYYGSYWEFLPNKPKTLDDALNLREHCFYTDDTMMTIAIAKSILSSKRNCRNLSDNAIYWMRKIGTECHASYGGSFMAWLHSDIPHPYYSWGNGASMRVSPAPLSSKTMKEALLKCRLVTEVTHDHPFALEWATIVSCIIFLAKEGRDKNYIMKYLFKFAKREFNIIFSEEMDINYLHENYVFTESSQDTVPQAIHCFFASDSFADCLAKSLYVGGDSDTLSAIACSMASVYYGDKQVSEFVKKLPALPKELQKIVNVFQRRYL